MFRSHTSVKFALTTHIIAIVMMSRMTRKIVKKIGKQKKISGKSLRITSLHKSESASKKS